jgi:hypothetical protein
VSGGDHGGASLVTVGLSDPRAQTLEAAHIAEMNDRYGSGGPGRVVPERFDPPGGCFWPGPISLPSTARPRL